MVNKIGVDVDGVLADFNTSFVKRLISDSKCDNFGPTWRPDQIQCWNYPTEQYGYDKAVYMTTWEKIWTKDRAFWFSLKPFPEVPEQLKRLSQLDVDIYFITDRKGPNPKEQTIKWLELVGVTNPQVLISGHKAEVCHALGIDYYIDDKQENVASILTPTTVIMREQSWNHPIDGILRVPSIKEFVDVVANHLK